MNINVLEIQKMIKYEFKDKDLLMKALMHSSYVNEKHLPKHESNERLEFLGDAVLELISSEYLFRDNTKMPEGELTKNRASMVCEQALAYCAREIQIGEYLQLGKGEEITGGRNRDSIVSDALEALIGAIYLDGGFANAKEFIYTFVLNDLNSKKLFYDSKTILQEIVQGHYTEPVQYVLINEEGPDHNKSFEVAVKLSNKILGTGIGRTKKLAEQKAAYKAILKLQQEKK